MAPLAGRKGHRNGRIRKREHFESSRITEALENLESTVEDVDQINSNITSDEPVSDSDSESEPQVRPYNALLEAFNVQAERNEHRRKRRKLDAPLENGKTNGFLDHNRRFEEGKEHVELEELREQEPELDHEQLVDEVDSGDEGGTSSDPFDVHFARAELSDTVKSISEKGWQVTKQDVGKIGKLQVFLPPGAEARPLRAFPKISLSSLNLKRKLVEPAGSILQGLEDEARLVTPMLFGYEDVLFGDRTFRNADTLRSLTCIHALNHVLKTRDRVLKNTARLQKDDADPNVEHRDQGYTRPKVLVLLPTRQSCARYIKSMVDLIKPEQQENRKRFEDGFTQTDGSVPGDRPDDYRELFEGNDDDMFRLGVKFTRKTVKFFSQFYNSDIIFASPLGLRRGIDGADLKKRDSDFLSSIELLVIDQTDALLMQNWDHVTYIMAQLNLQPREAHGCDFSRVRPWYLDGHAKHLRQTVVFSAFLTPEMNSLFSSHMHNIGGKIKYQPVYNGSVLSTGHPIKQTFSRFSAASLQAEPESRFKFFTSTIVPWIQRSPRPPEGGLGIVIFIPSYFDFVRVRNYFGTSAATTNISFGSISENSSPAEPEVRRTRSHFLSGKHSVLLYSGRAHHFYRYMIKGVKSVVVYQLPDNPLFYKEAVAGWIGASITAGRISGEESRARVLFSKLDALKLERIVGTERVGSMLGGGDTFDFV